jgi:hypothetical protein
MLMMLHPSTFSYTGDVAPSMFPYTGDVAPFNVYIN